MSVKIVSLLASRLGFQMSSVTSGTFRQASRGAKVWSGQSYAHGVADHRPRRQRSEMFEDEPDMEDVEEKLQALVGEQRKKQRTVKYHQIRRQMSPKGAPERNLSRDAMEQIRYLKQEAPEEWTVERLAEGFSVSPDVIFRVLRSKFVPTPERKAKQDAMVLAKLHQQTLPSGAKPGQGRPQLPGPVKPAMLPGSVKPAMLPWSVKPAMLPGSIKPATLLGPVKPALLPAGGAPGALVTLPSQSLMPREDGMKALATTGGSLAPMSTKNRVALPFSSKHSSLTELSRAEEDGTADDVFEEEEEEDWDGYVFTEEQLEELVGSTKPSPVTQHGNEFFDSDGIFLYRI